MNRRGRSLPAGSNRRRDTTGGRGRPTRIRISVVDDHEVVRRGLRSSLEQEPDMEVVGEVRTGDEAIQIARERQPDVMLLDVQLGDTDGPAVCERVRTVAPATAVVILTSHRQDGMVLRSLAAGARGYVIKDVALAELKRMIRAVYRGECVLDPTVAPQVIAAATGSSTAANQDTVKNTLALTDIDIDIVRHLARGLTNKQIGARIHRSPHTVKDHLEKIGDVLEVGSRTEIVATALRIGLI